MSNFRRKGKRLTEIFERRKIKNHTKEFYKILDELDKVAILIFKNKDKYNETDIAEVASKYTDIKFAKLEKHILLHKLENLKINAKSKDK